MMTMESRILTEEEVMELEEGEVTTVNSGGTEVAIPAGMTAWDMIEMLEVTGNVEYELKDTTLTITMRSVGTKGLQ